MDLVDEQDRAGLFGQGLDHRLEPLLELAAELGSGKQRAQVERIQGRVFEDLRHLAFVDGERQAFRERSFPYTGLADVDRVVLPPPAEDLDGPLDLRLAAHERVEPAVGGARDQIDAIGGERIVGQAAVLVVALRLRVQLVVVSRRPHAGLVPHFQSAVRDVPEQIQPRNTLFFQQIQRVGVALAVERHQHVAAVDGLFPRRLHLHRCPLQHPLEGAGLFRIALAPFRKLGLRLGQVAFEVPFQLHQPGPAGAQDPRRDRVAQQRVEKVLQRHMLVPPRLGLGERQPQTRFQLFGDRQAHSGSIVHRKGNSAALAICSTVETLVSAIS